MPQFRCVLHGSFRKHFAEIQEAYRIFTEAGIEVIAPARATVRSIQDGFAILETDQVRDPRMIELLYLQHLRRLGEHGFSYFVDPEGYIGASVSYELGIAQVTNIPCFFLAPPAGHPAYVHGNACWTPALLAEYIVEHGALPQPRVHADEHAINALWEKLMVPGSVVAVGAIIEHADPTRKQKEVLLVKTHKWGGRYSVVGEKVRRNERIDDALIRGIREETGLRASVGRHICTFDQIKNSGYYQAGTQHIFVDKVVTVGSRRVRLNEEAQEYIWMPAPAALRELPLEPNARHTLEIYAGSLGPRSAKA
jgi:ADP-ribose pyrophosphatase YjhB (NUDIX family)